MFMNGYKQFMADLDDSDIKADDVPQEVAFYLNKRFLVPNLDPSQHGGWTMKCAIHDKGVGNPFKRKSGVS